MSERLGIANLVVTLLFGLTLVFGESVWTFRACGLVMLAFGLWASSRGLDTITEKGSWMVTVGGCLWIVCGVAALRM